MERGSPFHSEKYYSLHNDSPTFSGENFSEDMTQDSGPSEEDNKEHIQLLDLDCATDDCPLELKNFDVGDEHNVIKGERQVNSFHEDASDLNEIVVEKTELELNNSCGEPVSDLINSKCNTTDFTISNSVNSMKSIRMNIRRKRFCSNSSAVSNNDSVSEEKRPCRRVKKRRKRTTTLFTTTVFIYIKFGGLCFLGYVKDDNILTTSERYVTHSGEVAFGLINEQHMAMEMAAAAANSANLEVSSIIKSHL